MDTKAPVSPSRLIAALAVGSALVLAACGGGSENDDNDTPEPTPTPGEAVDTPENGGGVLLNQVCPPEDPAEDDGYCDFVASLHHDLEGGDFSRLTGNLAGRELECTEAGGPCDQAGETVHVLPFTYNDDGADTRVSEVEAQFQSVFEAIAPEAEDEYGGGSLGLYAVAVGFTEPTNKAIVLTGMAGAEPARFTLMLNVVRHDEDWLFTSAYLRDEDASELLEEIAGLQSAGSFWRWQLVETIDPPLGNG